VKTILLIQSPKVCVFANRNVLQIYLIHMPNKDFLDIRIKNFKNSILLIHLPNKNHLTNGLIEIFCKKKIKRHNQTQFCNKNYLFIRKINFI